MQFAPTHVHLIAEIITSKYISCQFQGGRLSLRYCKDAQLNRKILLFLLDQVREFFISFPSNKIFTNTIDYY